MVFFFFNFSLHDNSGIIKRLEDFTFNINIFAVHAFDSTCCINRANNDIPDDHTVTIIILIYEKAAIRNGRFPIKLWGNI